MERDLVRKTNVVVLDDGLPIVPDEGLGGIRLRSNVGDYEDIFFRESPKSGITGPFQVWYTPAGLHFQFAVDVRDGRIFMIKACPGYQGALFGNIRVGMSFAEARKLLPGLWPDPTDKQVYVRDCPGVVMDVSGAVFSGGGVHRTIEWIALYAPERFESPRWKIL